MVGTRSCATCEVQWDTERLRMTAPAERHLALDPEAFVALLRQPAPAALAGRSAGRVVAVLGDSPGAATFAAALARDWRAGARLRPLVVIAPLDGLTAHERTRAVELLRRLARMRPVVLTTVEERVAALADLVVVCDGRMPVAQGPPAAVLGSWNERVHATVDALRGHPLTLERREEVAARSVVELDDG